MGGLVRSQEKKSALLPYFVSQFPASKTLNFVRNTIIIIINSILYMDASNALYMSKNPYCFFYYYRSRMTPVQGGSAAENRGIRVNPNSSFSYRIPTLHFLTESLNSVKNVTG